MRWIKKYDKRVVLGLTGFLFVNLLIAYSLHFSIIAATCMTKVQVQSDSRCLYIWNNQIYNIDTKSNPHHGHQCGTDVTSVLPSSHQQNQASYLLPNYIANVCPATTATPTPSPTTAPRATYTPTPTIAPRSTPTSSPTGNPGSGISFSVTLFLHGIYNAGDNVNPNSGGNTNPQHTQRTVMMKVYNASNIVTATGQGTVTYNSSAGNFTGSVSVGSVPAGSYTVSISTNNYLSKLYSGFQQVNGSQTLTLPAIYLTVGDINNDGQIDITDYNILIGCFGSKQTSSTCTNAQGADLDDNGKVDGVDYNLLIRELSVQK